MRQFSRLEEFVNNLPYIMMTLLGSGVIALGFEMTVWAWIGAGAYFAYGVAGAVWIMLFVCPSCHYYGTRSCPCGYGTISAKLVRKGDRECFADKFRRHIPVIVPLWFIPLGAGGAALLCRSDFTSGFSWRLAAMLAAFAVDALVVLPLVSTRHGCAECPQGDECPWMAHGK